MIEKIDFEKAFSKKEEKERLLKTYKEKVHKYYDELINDEFFEDDPFEHPNKNDVKFLKTMFLDSYNYLLSNNVSLSEVNLFCGKLNDSFEEEFDQLDEVYHILLYFNLYRIYGIKLLQLSTEDISLAIDIFSKFENPAKKQEHCCDLIVNRNLFDMLKANYKDETALKTKILSINSDMNSYKVGINPKEYEEKRNSLLLKVTNQHIEDEKANRKEIEEMFNIGIFNPRDFANKVKNQANIFFDFGYVPEGVNPDMFLSYIENSLDTLEDDLTNLDESLKRDCYHELREIWTGDDYLIKKILNVLKVVEKYKTNKVVKKQL